MPDDPERILFYREGDLYGFLSNFSRHPIELDGYVWATSEHYFQAQKFFGTGDAERVRLAPTAGDAARLGRKLPGLRPDWEAAKEEIMLRALRAKFGQHRKIRAQLLATGEAELVEHTKNDRYWADGGDGLGKNRLGKLLMQVRAEVRAEEARR
jgi:ribA/ribD-fused uncharacterized protein